MGKKDRCASWHGDDDDISKGRLDKPDPGNVSQNDPTSLGKRSDAQNVVPEWVMCSNSNGQNVVVFSRDQIANSLAVGFDLWEKLEKTPPNKHRRQYPHKYHKNKRTPRNPGAANPRRASSMVFLLNASTTQPLLSSTEANSRNPRRLIEFSLFPSGPPYSGGAPDNERVIFNDCGKLAAVMTHRLTGNNELRLC